MSRLAPRVQRVRRPIQAKLEVTAVNDPLELEADKVADQVVSTINAGATASALAARESAGLARSAELVGRENKKRQAEEELAGPDPKKLKRVARAGEEEELLQGKRIARQGPEEELPMQGKRVARAGEHGVPGPEGGAVSAELERAVESSSGGAPMPADLRNTMEAGFGADFGAVRLHVNSPLAPQLGALAFARGADVHFAPGQFDPSSTGGQHLIAHELTHVVQQGGAAARALTPDGPEGADAKSQPAEELRAGIEQLSGLSVDEVKVHYKSSVPAQLGALALAQGSEVHIAPDAERHIAHEAFHVVQQGTGRIAKLTI